MSCAGSSMAHSKDYLCKDWKVKQITEKRKKFLWSERGVGSRSAEDFFIFT